MRTALTMLRLGLLCPLFLAGCSKEAPAPSTASAPAARTGPAVVSLGPALTLLATQIGAADALVGVS